MQKMNLSREYFYGMVVIGSLSMVGDGGGFGGWGGDLVTGGEGWGWVGNVDGW